MQSVRSGLVRVALGASAIAATLPLIACKHGAPAAQSEGGAVPGVSTPAVKPASPAAAAVDFVPGSTHKVCQLTMEMDRELHQPTANRTFSRFGLIGTDLGYSFEHHGKLFFLFGDSVPAPTFHGQPNGKTDPPRSADADDAIAFTTLDAAPGTCPTLDFITQPNGAYRSPVVLRDGRPAITLRTNEVPISGFSEAGKMYVLFGTDNDLANPTGQDKAKTLQSAPRRTVMAASTDDGSTFQYLYDFSSGPGAKFINVPVARGPQAYFFWGAQGGELYRRSPPYFARKLFKDLDHPAGMQYFTGTGADGQPRFSASEADAVPLFHDVDASGQVADCIGEFSVDWNRFLKRWVMLYNCRNTTPTTLPGISMRTAEWPWGPWSAPQTVFNAARDGALCHYIHRAVTPDQPQCDDLAPPERLGVMGGNYAPYIISRYSTGDEAQGISTIYYTMGIWNPYTQVVMKTTLQRAPSP